LKRTAKQIKEEIKELKQKRRRIKRNGYTKKWRDKMRKDPIWLKKEHKRQRIYYLRTRYNKLMDNPSKKNGKEAYKIQQQLKQLLKVKNYNNGEYP